MEFVIIVVISTFIIRIVKKRLAEANAELDRLIGLEPTDVKERANKTLINK